jgi:hypothetical protein
MNNGDATAKDNAAVAMAAAPPPTTGRLAFSLVVIMLGILFVLTLALITFVSVHTPPTGTAEDKVFAAVVEYGKWAFSTLVGAFGAWIGAGAAYFFGKENLAESSRSTAEALRIQQQGLRNERKVERISELPLTAMNGEFSFNEKQTKHDVTAQLAAFPDYWWVPVLDLQKRGTLQDVIHARVFWDPRFADADPISKVVEELDKDANLKKLHGGTFFQKVNSDDKISDVLEAMKNSGTAVGIVVDGKGVPTYCFTRQNLLNANI